MPNTNCSPGLKRYLQRENRNMVDSLRDSIKNRAVRDEDYPAVAIACENGRHQAYGHSLKCHSSIKTPVKYVKPLNKELSAFGIPPMVKFNPKNGKTQFIGTCAEDSAANSVMIKRKIASGHYPQLKDLVFTEPIRARTYQRVKFCEVCMEIF